MASSGSGGRWGYLGLGKPKHSWFGIIVTIAATTIILFVLASLGFGVYNRASCKVGHEEFTGKMACWGSQTYMTCEPQKEFVCDER